MMRKNSTHDKGHLYRNSVSDYDDRTNQGPSSTNFDQSNPVSTITSSHTLTWPYLSINTVFSV